MFVFVISYTRELRTSRRRRFAGAERGLRVSQFVLNLQKMSTNVAQATKARETLEVCFL
jgi:hypothetical protein